MWKKTIFILTYDENDGYFDHIPPFVAPDPEDQRTGKCSPGVNTTGVEYIRREQELSQGYSEKQARGGPIGLGFRVPMIIASPWSRGGKVNSQVFDHTSSLQFLESFLNEKLNKSLKEENISEWRRTICGDLTSAFTKYDGEKIKDFPFLHRDSFLETIHNAKFKSTPSNFRKFSSDEIAKINRDPSLLPSRQEEGLRPASPLPYELYAEGSLSKNQSNFEITMKTGNTIFGDDSAGAPYIIYAPGDYLTLDSEGKSRKEFEPVRVWHFAVTAGDSITEQWPLAHFKGDDYHLRVYGPNGFYREYQGNAKDPMIDMNYEYGQNGRSKSNGGRNMTLKMNNLDKDHACEIEIVDNAYNQKPISKTIPSSNEITILLDQDKSFGWYDFSVHVKGNSSFSRRFAGRIENGEESFSDPQMGEV